MVIKWLFNLVAVACIVKEGRAEDDACVNPIPATFNLTNGVRVPLLGFGLAGLGDGTKGVVEHAVEAGFTHFDSAQAQEWYNEAGLGQALEGMDDSARSALFLVTKLHPRDYLPKARAREALQASPRNLGTEVIDLVLLHRPNCWYGSCEDAKKDPWKDAWEVLQEWYLAGKVRAIGVSNFNTAQLRELWVMGGLPGGVRPHVVQNWMDPYHQDRAVRRWCKENGVLYTAYSQFGAQWQYMGVGVEGNVALADPVIVEIAEKHQVHPAMVVLSWALQEGISVIPRSSKQENIRANAKLFGPDDTLLVFLAPEDVEKINSLDGKLRANF